MPSASNNNQSNTKLVKQTSVNSVNSGGAVGTSGGNKSNKKITENTTKNNVAIATSITTTNNNETSSIKSAKEDANNVVAAIAASQQQQQNNNGKNWETASTTGNAASNTVTNKDNGNDALNPMKLTFTTIEHKIRNLEKRKTKLEGYRAIQATGKELSLDQRAAVAKYDAVMATLDFARDLVKQMQQFTKDAEKEQKKQARKELIAKAQAETIKIREVLIIQNILSCLTDDTIRNDFLSGENGALKVERHEMDILEKFCIDVQTRRPETSADVPFATSAQKAAEVFSMTIDARPKQYGETTYENVKRLFQRMQDCNYLDKIYLADAAAEPNTKTSEKETNPIVNNCEETTIEINNRVSEVNDLDEGIEKLNVNAGDITQTANENNVDNAGVLTQVPPQQQQTIIKEHLDLQQVAITNLQQPQSGPPLLPVVPLAQPTAAVASFQPTVNQGAHSGTTTPVHVAMYYQTMQQPTPQQIQQMATTGSLIDGVPTNAVGQIMSASVTPQQVQPAPNSIQVNQQQQSQQRQILSSPVGQPGVAGAPITLHNANPQQQPPPPGHFNPTPVHTVEQNFFKHQPPPAHVQQQPQQQQQQYLQQIRPLAEVIGSGKFYFLQDSELDSPDLNNQAVPGVPQNTIVFEQQISQQSMQQNKTTQNLIQEPNITTTSHQQQQLQQASQQLPLAQQQHQQQQQQTATQTTILTQTFTNQSFPQMPPPPPNQQQTQIPPNSGLLTSNTPSPLFQQQQQAQPQPKANNTNNQQLFSPVQNQNMAPTPHQQQQSQLIMATANEVQQQQAPLMMINHLAGAGPPSTPLMQQQQQEHQQQQQQQGFLPQQVAPQNPNLLTGIQQQQLPPPTNSTISAGDMSQTPKNSGFPFEIPVVAGLNYEQQMQNKLNAEKVLNAIQEANAAHLHKNDLINEWDDTVIKGSTSSTTNSQQDFKSSGATNVQVTDTSTKKWSAEVNANSPITVQQTQTRKNEWTSSSNTNNNVSGSETSVGGNSGYGNDNRAESNHWHPQDSGGYGRSSTGNRGQGGGSNPGGYQQRQRNDDRRDDRRPGGGSYRGRSNYGSGNPQQNGQSRGGGGNSSGIYFRNNENAHNSYYQNGTGSGGGGGHVYPNKDSRYESRNNGGGNYRAPRGSDNSVNPRSNGPPPRHMNNRTSGGGNSNTANSTSSSYMNSRQSSNRMPLGVENKN